MNGWLVIVLGLILVGVGGFLGFYGAQLNNRADNAEASKGFNTQIAGVLEAIASAKASVGAQGVTGQGTIGNPTVSADTRVNPSAGEEAQKKLASIEQGFSKWASNFIAQRDLKKSQLERTKLEERNKELEISNQYRKVLEFAIDVLRGSVNAYNTSAGTTFQIKLPDLPINLYDVRDRPWVIGTVDFGDRVVWTIRIWAERPVDEKRLPYLEFIIENPALTNPGPDVVQISLSPPDYSVVSHGGGIVSAVSLNSRDPIDSYEKTLPAHLQTLIETQIASLPKK